MSRRIVVRAQAEEEIASAALWYEERERGLGLDCLSEIRRAIQRAAENPGLVPLLRMRPEVRRILVRRFPYRVFFIVTEDAIVVFAVLHCARHDRRWRTRIE